MRAGISPEVDRHVKRSDGKAIDSLMQSIIADHSARGMYCSPSKASRLARAALRSWRAKERRHEIRAAFWARDIAHADPTGDFAAHREQHDGCACDPIRSNWRGGA